LLFLPLFLLSHLTPAEATLYKLRVGEWGIRHERAEGTDRILMVLRRGLHSEQQEEGKEQGVERRRRHERTPQRSHCYWQPEAPEVAEAPLKKMHALLCALYTSSVSRWWGGTCTLSEALVRTGVERDLEIDLLRSKRDHLTDSVQLFFARVHHHINQILLTNTLCKDNNNAIDKYIM